MHTTKYLAALALCSAAACASGLSVQATGRGPAYGADARIELEEGDAGNHQLAVKIEHLVPPHRIDGKFDQYAVWIDPEHRTPRLVGILDYDEEDRAGKLETLTPYEKFDLLVTAERSGRPSDPHGTVVLSERIDR